MDILKEIKKLIDEQITKAKRFEIISKGTKDTEPKYAWKGRYDAWLLEPRHIAIGLGITLSGLETVILEEENADLSDLWNDYKRFQKEVMLHDENFSTIRAQLAEFALEKFDKNETTSTDAIVKLPNSEIVELKLKIKELEKKLGVKSNG